MHHHTITDAASLAAARLDCPARDQARELTIGCETWGILHGGAQRGQMSRWPSGRGAIDLGSDSLWGDWDGDVLVLDDGWRYGTDGSPVEAEEGDAADAPAPGTPAALWAEVSALFVADANAAYATLRDRRDALYAITRRRPTRGPGTRDATVAAEAEEVRAALAELAATELRAHLLSRRGAGLGLHAAGCSLCAGCSLRLLAEGSAADTLSAHERHLGAPIRDLADEAAYRALGAASTFAPDLTDDEVATWALDATVARVADTATSDDRTRLVAWVREGQASR